MEIFHKIGGFSLEETNTIRGLMKVLSKADKKKKDFIKGNPMANNDMRLKNLLPKTDLDKKIKLKLQSLVENVINEQPNPLLQHLEALVAKYGSKFVNLFGDDVIRAAEVNLGDDAVKLLGKSIDDATLIAPKGVGFLSKSGRTIKFDRISSTSKVVNWAASTIYKYGALLRYKNQLYKVTNEFTEREQHH